MSARSLLQVHHHDSSTSFVLCEEPHGIYRKLHQSARGLQESTTINEDTYVLNSRIMSNLLNILICVGMILLNSLMQYFMFIVVINLSSTYDTTVVSIYDLLFMFIIYFWIKIKLKVLIFPSIQKP
jgi:hypothetical protein